MKHTKTRKNTLQKKRAAWPRVAAPADPFNPTPRKAPNHFAFRPSDFAFRPSHFELFTFVHSRSRYSPGGGGPFLQFLRTTSDFELRISHLVRTQHSALSTQHSELSTQPSTLNPSSARLFRITLFSIFFTLSFPKLLSLCYPLAAP